MFSHVKGAPSLLQPSVLTVRVDYHQATLRVETEDSSDLAIDWGFNLQVALHHDTDPPANFIQDGPCRRYMTEEAVVHGERLVSIYNPWRGLSTPFLKTGSVVRHDVILKAHDSPLHEHHKLSQ